MGQNRNYVLIVRHLLDFNCSHLFRFIVTRHGK